MITSYLVELDYIWMTDFLEYVYLSRYSLYITFVLDPVFFKDLDRNFLTCNRVRSDSHFTECSRAKGSALK